MLYRNKANATTTTATGDMFVLKMLKLDNPYWTPNIFHDHWKDALIMERLTAEPMVLDIYGFCGNSDLFDYAPEGDLEHILCLVIGQVNDICLVPANHSPLERLQMGHNSNRRIIDGMTDTYRRLRLRQLNHTSKITGIVLSFLCVQ